MLVWTVCAYRKPTMSEEEFHHYMTSVHAPLVRECLARHGIVRYTMVLQGLIIFTVGFR